MARTRTFIAIDLDKNLRDQMTVLQGSLARCGAAVKWVDPKNMHLTLLFLGEVDDRDLPAVCKVVSAACAGYPAFPLAIEKVGCFPNPRRPRVLWVGVGEGTPEVVALHDKLEPPLLELGCYRRENRQYTPHLTLGRVTGEDSIDALIAALTRKASWQGGHAAVREVRVMASHHGSAGPEYMVLGRAKLG